MESILIAIVPVFILIGVGFVFQKLLPDEPASAALLCKIGVGSCNTWTSILNRFALYLALPALIISSLLHVSTGEEIVSGAVIWMSVVALVAVIATLFFIGRRLDVSPALLNTYIFGAFFGNVAYIGFPFLAGLIPGSTPAVSVLVAIHVGVAFTVGLLVLERSRPEHGSWRDIAAAVVKNPLLWAVIVGLMLLFLNVSLPRTIENAISMLGDSASPVVLIAMGTFIATQWRFTQGLKHALVISGMKLVLLPLVFLAAAFLFHESGHGATLSILEAAMPVALTNFALSERYPMDQSVTANAIIISTMLSFVTLIAWSVFML